MTIDLDAIQARADAATEGPWKVWGMSVLAEHAGTSDVATAIPVADTQSYPSMPPRTWNANFIAHARSDVPSLISLVRELQAGIPARVVLDGDPDEIEAALDALPHRAVVTCDAVFEPGVWIRTSADEWHGSGMASSRPSRFLARYCAPLVVIR